MSIRSPLSAAVAAVALTQVASAAMVTFTNAPLWNFYSTNHGASVATENFNSYNGSYASGLTGSAGGIQWQAIARGGLVANSSYLAARVGDAVLTFSMAPSVQGVAGNFFATDAGLTVVPAIISVTLNDGSTYVGYSASASDFVGFYSTGASISSIAVSVAGNGPAGSYFATADNLYFAVVGGTTPAPGAFALIGAAGLVINRRRR
jgi:hypothetical protein